VRSNFAIRMFKSQTALPLEHLGPSREPRAAGGSKKQRYSVSKK
jgi:hypothetical protein